MADIKFELDLSAFLSAIEGAADDIADGAKRGMHDALDAWVREAVDVAPIDKSTLRRSITKAGVEQTVEGVIGTVTANATEKSKRYGRFNYAYYIHERDAGGKKLRKPGTVKRFLAEPAEKHAEKWLRDIEDEIKDELKRKGW